MAKKKEASINFEQSLQELDSLVTQLEGGELSLEESLNAFERGIKLTRECQQQLTAAEQKVSLLVGDTDELQLIDFDNDDNQ